MAKYVFLAALVASANLASAQGLSVVSSSPVDGAVGVPISSTIEFRLTDPLPAMGTAFTEQVLWSPRDALQVNRYGHAQDGTGEIRIIFYEVEHQPDTDYAFIVHGVRDATGDVLDRPFVLNYTTAASSGTASVSGSIATGAGVSHPLDDTVVLLLRAYGRAEPEWDIARATVADASGAFSITGVRPGTYWPLAVHFADDDANADPSYGILDMDGDRVPDSLVVGGDVEGIELVTSSFVPQTALTATRIAYQAAALVAEGNVLAGLFAEVSPPDEFGDPAGTAQTWGFSFCSSTDDLLVDVSVTSVDALINATSVETDTVDVCQRLPVPETFVDSDVAMATAEANGGAAFRARFTEEPAVFFALGDLPLAVRPAEGGVFWAIDYVSPPGEPFDQLTVFVDGQTGEIVEGQPVYAERPDAPAEFALAQNYPNPFNPQTRIEYTLDAAAHVRLTVFDVQGRAVAELENGFRGPGRHDVVWDASGYPGGVYWYRMNVDGSGVIRSMVYLK